MKYFWETRSFFDIINIALIVLVLITSLLSIKNEHEIEALRDQVQSLESQLEVDREFLNSDAAKLIVEFMMDHDYAIENLEIRVNKLYRKVK